MFIETFSSYFWVYYIFLQFVTPIQEHSVNEQTPCMASIMSPHRNTFRLKPLRLPYDYASMNVTVLIVNTTKNSFVCHAVLPIKKAHRKCSFKNF